MKKYICDICKKEFGYAVASYIQPAFKVSEFDSGFFIGTKSDADVCSECHKKISEAQNKAIEEIRKG
jgi:DNA-directed RNA polymerase subunit RPC12/RpoP